MIMEICDFFFYSDLDLHDHNDYDDNDYVGHNDLWAMTILVMTVPVKSTHLV